MNKRTNKDQTGCQRRYASGILMYRERKAKFTVPANTTVGVLKHGPKQTLVKLPKEMNGWMTMIDNTNLPAFRNTTTTAPAPKAAVKGKGKGKKGRTAAPVVAAEIPNLEPAI